MRHSIRLRLVIASLIIAASAIPNLGNELHIMGSFLNFYRIVVVILALFTLFLFRSEVCLSGRRSFLIWFVFLFAWFAYGLVLFVASPYADFDRGLRELFALLCGALCFYILSCLELSPQEIEMIFRVMFVILCGFILLAFWEIATGNHLSSSMFNDPTNKVIWRLNKHAATGIMYNVNDFSALITLMLPVVIGRFRINFRRAYLDPGWALVVLVAVINRINDANFCNAALLIGTLGYLLLRVRWDRRKLGLILGATILLLVGVIILYSTRDHVDSEDVVSRTMELIQNSQKGQGSLRARLLIYRDGFAGAWISGFLGLGPGGFFRYYTLNPSDSHFVDPHSLFLEILSEYGLVIFLIFAALVIFLFRRMRALYKEGTTETFRLWGEMGVIWIIIYCIVTFASSSYLQSGFHWTLLALICLMYETGKEKEERSYEYQKSSDLGTAYR
ncbi:MAG: O-antigen ligase family protein [Eubacterium sp.]|nr:O-antigen ligase family protein [Eubacterium sp.]